jgi:hypothetical protein
VREQFVDATVQMRRQPRKHVLELRPWIVAIERGRLHEAHHDRCTLTGKLAAEEEPCSPAHSPRTNQILAMVVVHGQVAIQQVLRQRCPGIQAVVHSLGCCTAVGHSASLKALGAFERVLPLRKPLDLMQRSIAQFVLSASEGLTGEISRLLNEAAALAIADGTERITLEHLKHVASADR